MKTHKVVLLCVAVCLMVLAACPVYANWMPTAGELGSMFGQAMGEQICRDILGDKAYNESFPHGMPDNVTNPQPTTPQYRPQYVVPSKPWWKFW